MYEERGAAQRVVVVVVVVDDVLVVVVVVVTTQQNCTSVQRSIDCTTLWRFDHGPKYDVTVTFSSSSQVFLERPKQQRHHEDYQFVL